jgi:hypothetical protein
MNAIQTPVERLDEEAWIAQYRAALDLLPEEQRHGRTQKFLVRTQRHLAESIGKLTSVVSRTRKQTPSAVAAALHSIRLLSRSKLSMPGRKKAS